MKIEQTRWTRQNGWESQRTGRLGDLAQLVLLFGSTSAFRSPDWMAPVKAMYPEAHLWGCSTAGEIYGTTVSDDSLILTAICFEHSAVRVVHARIRDMETSFDAGERLTRSLPKEGLVHAMVLSDGLMVNGSDLVRGLSRNLPEEVTVTGGLSGDGERFQETFVLCDDAMDRGVIAVVGFYGPRLRIGYGSLGGWDPFGPERLITRAKGNVLYELDGKSALELYKKYLGAHARGLPATGLFFPLSLRTHEGQSGVVRTILAVDERDQSMTFAGDVPEGAYARLMKANFDRLIDGAVGAAKTSCAALGAVPPDLAILISCVGRKMVLRQRVEEEVEGVRDVLGSRAMLAGFYSYGEISPFTPDARCELHNQTMSITTISER